MSILREYYVKAMENVSDCGLRLPGGGGAIKINEDQRKPIKSK